MRATVVILVFLGALALTLALRWRFHRCIVLMHRIPRIIWVFWHSGIQTAPRLIQRCVENMRVLHPEWQVNVVTEDTVSHFLNRKLPPGLERLGIQQRADWYRLALLADHGGIWLDASVHLLRPITRCFDLITPADVQGFLWPGVDPLDPAHPVVLEVWALACPKNNWVVVKWLTEWERAIGRGLDAYCAEQPSPPSMLRHSYFAVSRAWLAVYRRDAARMCLRLQSSDTDGGPYYLHHLCQWDPERIARALLSPQDLRLLSCCFVKIRSVDRTAMENLLKEEPSNPKTYRH